MRVYKCKYTSPHRACTVAPNDRDQRSEVSRARLPVLLPTCPEDSDHYVRVIAVKFKLSVRTLRHPCRAQAPASAYETEKMGQLTAGTRSVVDHAASATL